MGYRGVVYCRTSPSGKCYVGQTVNEVQRNWGFRRSDIPYAGVKLEYARRKYPPEQWRYEVLDSVECEDLDEMNARLDILERYWIEKKDSVNKGYNATRGGGGLRGFRHSEETIRKIKLAQGVPIYVYTLSGDFVKRFECASFACEELGINGIHRCCLGNTYRTGNYICLYSPEDLSERLDILSRIPDNRPRPVVVYNRHTHQFVGEYPHAGLAADALGCYAGPIMEVCRGEKSRYRDWFFYYVDNFKESDLQRSIDLAYSKSVFCYSVSGEQLAWFASAAEARETLGSDLPITECCCDKLRRVGDFVFLYAKDLDKLESRLRKANSRKGVNTGGKPSSKRRRVEARKVDDPTWVQEFESVTGAAKALGLSQGLVSLVCSGSRNSTSGYVFRVLD